MEYSKINVKFFHIPKEIYIENSLVRFTTMCIPMGLFHLAKVVSETGCDVEIIHGGIEKALDPDFSMRRAAGEADCRLACFSLQWHLQLHEVFQATREIKESRPDVRVLLGGMTASFFAEDIMEQWPQVDFIIRGEAELPLRTLIQSGFSNLSSIPNLTWRDGGGKIVNNPIIYRATEREMGEIECTDLDLLRNYECYSGGVNLDLTLVTNQGMRMAGKIWNLYVGRGCSSNCAFCGGGKKSHSFLSRRNEVVLRPVESLVKDVRLIYEGYGIDKFIIPFSPPGMDRAYFPTLFDEISRNFDIALVFEYYDGVPDDLFIETFARGFKRSGTSLTLSPTYFSDRARKKFYPSGFSNGTLNGLLERLDFHGVSATLCFSPLPQESYDEIMRGVDFALEISRMYERVKVGIEPIELEPASPWSVHPMKYGMSLTRTGLSDYVLHHAKRRLVQCEEDLGYRFPDFDRIVQSLMSLPENNRFRYIV